MGYSTLKLAWFGFQKDLFLKLLIWNKRTFPYEKLTFFLDKLPSYLKIFFLHPRYKCDTPYRVWLILTTSWSNKKGLFLKFVIREIRKFPYEKLTFFLGKLYQKFFLSQSLPTVGIVHTKFGLIWSILYQKFFLCYTLGTHGILHTEIGLIWFSKRPIFKITYLKLAHISVWKTNFFPRQATKLPKNVFVLHPRYTCDTPYRVWLILTTSWSNKKGLFLKFVIREIRKFPYEKLTFFLGKLYQKFFLSQSLPTVGIVHTKFGSI